MLNNSSRNLIRNFNKMWQDWCLLRCSSATDVRIKRGKQWSAGEYDGNKGANKNSRSHDQLQPCRNGNRINGCNDSTTVGKLATPCRPHARAQRSSGSSLLPGKVKIHGSDRFVYYEFPFKFPPKNFFKSLFEKSTFYFGCQVAFVQFYKLKFDNTNF